MDIASGRRTRNTHPILAPGEWWTVDELALDQGLVLYYRLGRRQARPSELTDEQERTVLEAFGSLPMEAMADGLHAYRRSLIGKADASWEGDHVLELIGPLNAFVRRFGPIGVGWGGKFQVRNPEAERLAEEVERLRREVERAGWTGLGIDPDTIGPAPRIGEPFWIGDFWGHAPGRGIIPAVQRKRWFADRSWAERVRLGDDGVPQDNWLQIVDEYTDLRKTLALVEAIAQRDDLVCRDALRKFFRSDDFVFWVGEPDPARPDYRRVLKGVRPASGRERLFRLPAHQVDWLVFAKLLLADLIGRQIDFAMPLVDVPDGETLGVRWRATSVLEVVYLELLDHVRRRELYGVASCMSCRGPILRTRRAGRTGNQWHPGCQGGRVQRWREAHPGWRDRVRPRAARSRI